MNADCRLAIKNDPLFGLVSLNLSCRIAALMALATLTDSLRLVSSSYYLPFMSRQ